jgi:hypothetical protein
LSFAHARGREGADQYLSGFFDPQALARRSPAPPKTVVINARHGPRIEADQRVIVMAGRPEDLVAEAYASVFLVESGFAQQSDVARAFARSVRAIWHDRERDAPGGTAALGRSGADQYLSGSFDLHGAAG